MKKLFFVLALAFCTAAQAQLIDRNDIIIQAGGGLGLYRYQFTDVTNNVINPRDTSAAWSFPVQIEYGVNRWLGVGFCFTFNNFIEGDSAANEKATGMDFGLAANLHVPWSLKKFDLSASIGYGYSRFKYDIDDVDNAVAKAGGTVLFFGINPRLYFKEDGHLAITGWYRFSKYNYPKGKVTNDAGFEYDFKLDGPGNSFGLGLIFKI
ncbi:MAG TPA: outer membrane beta-barrel protein [Bacteroidia bacterium]|nr:outer membrane beta-barrel protein [Bacteroidia bacterium]